MLPIFMEALFRWLNTALFKEKREPHFAHSAFKVVGSTIATEQAMVASRQV